MKLHAITKKVVFSSLVSAFIIISGLYISTVISGQLATKNTEVVTVRKFGEAIKQAVSREFKLNTGKEVVSVSSEELNKWVESYIRTYSGEADLRLSYTAIQYYLESLAPSINIAPVNAKLTFEKSRAKIFVPSVIGSQLNIAKSLGLISTSIASGNNSAELVIDKIEPEITLEKVNNLGITTLIGRGESNLGKSPPSRVHNIKVGALKFNGLILKPGEEFSFNGILGEVDDKNGYQSELVIKNGQLVKEYGGGLCQVSTTVFRAAIFSGLPIVERRPHSFPVQYYNPQGFDSTIYPGVVDLKFVNDTSAHILIQTKLVNSNLTVEIYGSKDGREVTMDGPHQYGQKSDGSMKAYFVRKISKDGQLVKEERYDSVYKPPPPSPLERNPLE